LLLKVIEKHGKVAKWQSFISGYLQNRLTASTLEESKKSLQYNKITNKIFARLI
jgi:hypothetical protein